MWTLLSQPATRSLQLPVPNSSLLTSCSAHPLARFRLPAVRCLLFAVCYLLFAVYCLLFAVRCLPFAVCCSLFAVCCLPFAVRCSLFAVFCLFRRDAQIPHQERVDVSRLFDGFRRATRTMARLRINANQNWVISALCRL